MSFGSLRILAISGRRILVSRLRNPAVIRNIKRHLIFPVLAARAHLVPQEGADRDQESCAYNERGRQYSQIVQQGAPLPICAG